MKLYLIGNYSLLGTKSMYLYANILKKILNKNYNVEILQPKILLNKFNFRNQFIKKWLGYIDNYILFGLYLYFKINKSDLVHICDHANSPLFPFINTRKLMITCNDVSSIELIKNEYLKKFTKISFTGKIHQKIILFYLNKFKTIICISENTKFELLKLINSTKKNIEAIHMPFNDNFYALNNKEKIKFKYNKKIDFKFFLHVGVDAWYKNKINLVKIFNELIKIQRRKDFKLILIGNTVSDELRLCVERFKLENKVIFVQNISLRELRSYYSIAEALVFPSIREGFGWPIIEAQKCGCPVFTTNKGPMNELGLDTVFYIDPIKPKISSKIIDKKLLSKEVIINKGFKNVKRFSSKIFLGKMRNIYNKISN